MSGSNKVFMAQPPIDGIDNEPMSDLDSNIERIKRSLSERIVGFVTTEPVAAFEMVWLEKEIKLLITQEVKAARGLQAATIDDLEWEVERLRGIIERAGLSSLGGSDAKPALQGGKDE